MRALALRIKAAHQRPPNFLLLQQVKAQNTHTHKMPQIESWFGFVKDAECARLLVEAAIAGCIDAVSEYPLSTEFSRIRSGSVVVFVEYYKSDFMRTRWRDGFSWSSSKLCHPFLLYRQVERVSSKKQMHHHDHEQNQQQPVSQFSITPSSLRPNTRIMRDGLCKRTISIRGSNGRFYRVISYFTAQDVSSFYGLRCIQTAITRPSLQILDQDNNREYYYTQHEKYHASKREDSRTHAV
ncbi:Gti1/Pac2 family-domain-containing protein [Chytriomyces cf. hyalinus JEL632]|nr:Gti1/Pac2 family-domain-containing protein [Chytriomyces cf. hyalinus JEL632]